MKVNRDYLSLWGLLAIALIALIGYDAYCESTEDEPWLKPSKIMRTILTNVDEASSIIDTFPEDSIALAAENKVIEIDTLPKNILFIGDSMLEGLSPRLAAYCDVSGHTLRTVIWYSSTSEIWGNAHLLSKYINEYAPDFIFICLGANELFVRDIIEKRDKYVKSIITEIGDIPYLWIGPPNWKEDTGINTLIKNNAGEGNYFNSIGLEFKRKKDGAHPTAESAIEWMDSVARWMPKHCAHPIVMNHPEKTTSRPLKVFLHQPGTKP